MRWACTSQHRGVCTPPRAPAAPAGDSSFASSSAAAGGANSDADARQVRVPDGLPAPCWAVQRRRGQGTRRRRALCSPGRRAPDRSSFPACPLAPLHIHAVPYTRNGLVLAAPLLPLRKARSPLPPRSPPTHPTPQPNPTPSGHLADHPVRRPARPAGRGGQLHRPARPQHHGGQNFLFCIQDMMLELRVSIPQRKCDGYWKETQEWAPSCLPAACLRCTRHCTRHAMAGPRAVPAAALPCLHTGELLGACRGAAGRTLSPVLCMPPPHTRRPMAVLLKQLWLQQQGTAHARCSPGAAAGAASETSHGTACARRRHAENKG